VILQLSRCVNSTENDNKCRPQSEIDNFLLNAEFSMLLVTPSFSVDHFDIENPIKNSLREESFKMHTGMFISRQTYMRNVIYIDDQGLVTENPVTYNMYDKDIYRSTTDFEIKSPSPGVIYEHTVFILGESVDTYKRSFARLQSVVANIGGVVSSLMAISRFCAQFISSQMFTIFIGNFFADLSHGLSPSPLNNEYASNKTLQNSFSLKKPENYTPVTNFKNKFAATRKIRTLSFWDALCFTKCVTVRSSKILLDPCEFIFRTQFSCEYLIKHLSEFEHLKRIYFSEEQMFVFKHLSLPSLQDHFDFLKLQTKELKELDRLEGVLNQMMSSEDRVTKAMVKLF
jgi:hypothetical protein